MPAISAIAVAPGADAMPWTARGAQSAGRQIEMKRFDVTGDQRQRLDLGRGQRACNGVAGADLDFIERAVGVAIQMDPHA